jgi:dihydrofolate synthase / folylpolyglutamate synthase
MTSTDTAYHQCLRSMFGLRRFGIKLGLETISGVLSTLGDPQGDYRTVHVAGTNGKGSVASAVATILHRAGYRVGLYTSPHLVRFNERICIDGSPITDAEVVTAHDAVRSVGSRDREMTFFEYSTAMAFFAFSRRAVDWAIIETGMGGRLDATNVLRPDLTVITNISLEHQAYLGRTLAEIAGEKAGIIKPGIPLVTGVRGRRVVPVITARARTQGAPLHRLGSDFRVRRHPDGAFSYYGLDVAYPRLTTALPGYHQVDNAALALAGIEVLRRRGAAIPEAAVRQGLAENRWPGRLEVVSRNPFILLDGAHNLMAARNLASYLARDHSSRPITLVAGILDDKPYAAMLGVLLPLCRRAVLTRAETERALPPERLAEAAADQIADITVRSTVESALRYAIETAVPDEVICVAGSLYVVGEARHVLDRDGYFTPAAQA